MSTLGNLTIVEVGAGSEASSFESICVFGGEAIIDFGTYSTNKEYCLSSAVPYTALNELEFGSQTYSYLWSEASGNAANVIIKAAHAATTMADKTITVRHEANNTGGSNGTQYVADYLVTGYKHSFRKGEVNKTEFTVEQLTLPVETVASA